jgi:DNA-directed RNA polymerase delta subunit
MKILITESRLYTAFKGWMDSEISSGLYEWIKDEKGDIFFVDTNEMSIHLWLIKKSKELWVFKNLFTEIHNYFPLEETDLVELIGRYVSERFQIEGITARKAKRELPFLIGNIFKIKYWMDSKINSGLYEWKKDKYGNIWLVDTNNGYGHMMLDKKSKRMLVYNNIFTEIQNYFPLEMSDLRELIGRYVGNTFKIEGLKPIWTYYDMNKNPPIN